MYLEDNCIEKDALRQGDIITNIHLLGAINLRSILYSSSAETPKDIPSWTVPAPPHFGDAMVLSHNCEIALENKIKVTSIILAPLRDVNSATDQKRIQELIESNLIDIESPEASFLKYFYLEPHPLLSYEMGAVVDFSKCFSVRKQSYDYLLNKKVVQLTGSALSSMALKLALYFHRYCSKDAA